MNILLAHKNHLFHEFIWLLIIIFSKSEFFLIFLIFFLFFIHKLLLIILTIID
jgi:hypothetical protein